MLVQKQQRAKLEHRLNNAKCTDVQVTSCLSFDASIICSSQVCQSLFDAPPPILLTRWYVIPQAGNQNKPNLNLEHDKHATVRLKTRTGRKYAETTQDDK